MKKKDSAKRVGKKKAQPEVRGYRKTVRDLQIELVRFQRHVIAQNLKILVIVEGRDAAGKDGVIKRITEHLSPRETRVVALGKPSDRDRSSWYFQRYAPLMPAAQEIVLMNRSWYNRAGVERVMEFCTDSEYEEFMQTVVPFEHMLVRSGLKLLKYYLDISKREQKARLEGRRTDPLKSWKISPIDEVAIKHWNGYSTARNDMFARTHNPVTPWYVVRADDKKAARLNVIRHLLAHVDYPDADPKLAPADEDIVFSYDRRHLDSGLITR
jgi:polyphosphate kinase